MTIWVLTEEYNDYNQHGEYFVHAWVEQPTVEQLEEYVWSRAEAHHVLNGGGRRGYEDSWYNLRTVL